MELASFHSNDGNTALSHLSRSPLDFFDPVDV